MNLEVYKVSNFKPFTIYKEYVRNYNMLTLYITNKSCYEHFIEAKAQQAKLLCEYYNKRLKKPLKRTQRKRTLQKQKNAHELMNVLIKENGDLFI